MTFLRDSQDANHAAVAGKVHYLEKIPDQPDYDVLMRKLGFLEQLSYFLEDA